MKLELRPLMEIEAEVGPVTSIGMTPLGEVRQVQILGGTFTGQDLAGELLPGGSDWQRFAAPVGSRPAR